MTKPTTVPLVALLLSSCSTWIYSAKSDRAGADDGAGVTVSAVQYGDTGVIEVVNNGPRRVYLAWDGTGAILPSGMQQRVLKGSQRRMFSELSVPPQPIDPGAGIREVYVLQGVSLSVARSRPATGWDWGLCWLYSIGCWVGDAVWSPDDAYKAGVIPEAQQGTPLYELVVSIAADDETPKTVRLKVVSAGVDAKKLGWGSGP
jgi:hypothetical protein